MIKLPNSTDPRWGLFEGGQMKVGYFLIVLLAAVITQRASLAETSSKTKTRSTNPIRQQRATNNRASKFNSNASTLSTSSGLDSIYGYLEFRPSYTSNIGEFHTENTADVGYKLNSNLKTGYVQFYNTNLMNSSSQTTGLNLSIQDGFAYLKAKNLWESSDKHLALNYQLRLLTPTNSVKYAAGYRSSIRNQMSVSYSFTDNIKTDLSYNPIFHIYTQNGAVSSSGAFNANPYFDHQLVLTQEFHPSEKLTLSLQLLYQLTTYRQALGATNSGRSKKQLYFSPELDYELNPVHTLGVSFYTDNLISGYESGSNFSNGFKFGVAQLVWGINL